MKLCMIFLWFFIDISGSVSSFGPASRLPQDIISLHPWNAAGPPGKFMCQRNLPHKGSRVHVIIADFVIWGHLTRPRGLFRAQGSALTRKCSEVARGLRAGNPTPPSGLATLRVSVRRRFQVLFCNLCQLMCGV